MKVQTQTSIYEVLYEDGQFLVSKVQIVEKDMYTGVSEGKRYVGDQLILVAGGMILYRDQKPILHTSPLKSIE